MKKSKQRKLDKKRRAERLRRRQKPESLAYHGNKFKTEELIPVVYQTEVGIYESFVISDRKLTDHDVRAALEWLIRGIRGGTIAVPSTEQLDHDDEKDTGQGMLTWSIRTHWDEYFAEESSPGQDKLVGVLRTILGSLEVWGNVSPTSRGYLHYLEGFMGKLGGQCRKLPPDFEIDEIEDEADFRDFPDEEDNFSDEEQSELLLAGRQWTQEADADAGVVFRALADEMIADGQAEEVAKTCQQLMGETVDRPYSDELGTISIRAQQHLQPAPSRWSNIFGRLIGR